MAVERIKPSGRVGWLALRRTDITASQVGALFGEHEFLTPYHLWAIKTGRVSDAVDETPAMQRGRLLEPVAIQILREEHPDWRIEHNAAENIYFRDTVARLGATPDAIVHAPGRGKGVVQIKSVEASVFRKKWVSAEGEVEPPLWIALQATLEAHLVGASWAAVAPLVVGHGVEMPLLEVDLIPGLIDVITSRTHDFWELVNTGHEPPADFSRDGAVISEIFGDGDPNHEVDLSRNNRIRTLIAARQDVKGAISQGEALVAEIDAEVKAMMGNAHVAHLGQGQTITWKPQRREGHFVSPSVVRTLRYPKQKD